MSNAKTFYYVALVVQIGSLLVGIGMDNVPVAIVGHVMALILYYLSNRFKPLVTSAALLVLSLPCWYSIEKPNPEGFNELIGFIVCVVGAVLIPIVQALR